MRRLACGLAMILICFGAQPAQATWPEVDNYDGRFAGARSYLDSSIVYLRDLTNTNPYGRTYAQQVTYNKAQGGAWTVDPVAGGSCSLWSSAESVDIVIKSDSSMDDTGDDTGCFVLSMLHK